MLQDEEFYSKEDSDKTKEYADEIKEYVEGVGDYISKKEKKFLTDDLSKPRMVFLKYINCLTSYHLCDP